MKVLIVEASPNSYSKQHKTAGPVRLVGWLVVAALLTASAACSSQSGNAPRDSIVGDWDLVAIDAPGGPAPVDTGFLGGAVEFEFGEKYASTDGACNEIATQYFFDGNQMLLWGYAKTSAECSQPAMDLEYLLLVPFEALAVDVDFDETLGAMTWSVQDHRFAFERQSLGSS